MLLLARALICVHTIASSAGIDSEDHHIQLLQTKLVPGKAGMDASADLARSQLTSSPAADTVAMVNVRQDRINEIVVPVQRSEGVLQSDNVGSAAGLDNNQVSGASSTKGKEAFDDLQRQVVQLQAVAGSEATALQEKDAKIRSLQAELDGVKRRRADEIGAKVAPYIALPQGTTGVKINVGCNYQPMVECDPLGTVVCFLFDIQNKPIQYLRDLYRGNANMYIFNLGVSEYAGLAAFPTLGSGEDAQSTSLSDPNKESAFWNTGDHRGGVEWSGVITMAEVIDSIDPTIPILMVATDMQGHDFAAIASAGDRLKRVQALEVELYKDGVSTYAGVKNDYDADWLPHMTKMGFIENGCTPGYIVPGEANEWNCAWKPAT
jgi:hypothetical protein